MRKAFGMPDGVFAAGCRDVALTAATTTNGTAASLISSEAGFGSLGTAATSPHTARVGLAHQHDGALPWHLAHGDRPTHANRRDDVDRPGSRRRLPRHIG